MVHGHPSVFLSLSLSLIRACIHLFPKQCLHNGVLTFRVKELVAGRNGARGGGAGPWFRRFRCGFTRIPLRFDAPAVVSREFRPLLACSGLICGGPLGLRAATVHAVGWGLRFDAPAVVSQEFRYVPVVSREFRCVSIARIPASSGLFWRGPLRLRAGPPHCLGSSPA